MNKQKIYKELVIINAALRNIVDDVCAQDQSEEENDVPVAVLIDIEMEILEMAILELTRAIGRTH